MTAQFANNDKTMNTKALRQKILDLAIHGKLVPQDPNDEPASVLLERIKAEKERLIKEGKIKRSKQSKTACDKLHYPFELPEGWCWTTIEEVCSKIGSGSTPKGGNYSKEGIPFFRSQNVYNSGIVLTDIKYISNEVHQSMNGTEVVANDLLLNITGGSLGRCAIVPSNFDKGNVSQHVCILRTVLVKPDYLHAFILSSFFAKSMKITGSGREGLPKYNLEKMLLPLPPIKEQERIISETERLQTFVDQIEISEGKLSEFILQAKSKILDLAIHGKLVPQDPTDEPANELLKCINPNAEITCDNPQYGKLPKGWCYCLFSDLFQITMGQSPDGCSINNKQGVEFHQGKISFGDKYLKESDVFTSSPTKMAESQSLLLCVRAPVGVINITQRDICIGRGLCSLKPNTAIILDFAYYVLATYQQIFESKSTGSTFKAISGSVIRNEILMLPPLNEQHRIVAKIEELFAQLDNIASSL